MKIRRRPPASPEPESKSDIRTTAQAKAFEAFATSTSTEVVLTGYLADLGLTAVTE